jgi:Tryptophan-rich sensory protein (mitochondrial benzodiazepine receptor homolog)
MMITIAGWLLWQERSDPKAKPALIYYGIQILLNWTWAPIFFRFHLLGLSVLWAIALLFTTFMTIINAARKFELAGSLLTPYLFWLLYLTYLCGYVWLNN